jgi:hypothetical protein
MPHPALLRNAFVGDAEQRKRARYIWGLQSPFIPERQLTANDAAAVADYLRRWSGSQWPDEQTAAVYRAATSSGSARWLHWGFLCRNCLLQRLLGNKREQSCSRP